MACCIDRQQKVGRTVAPVAEPWQTERMTTTKAPRRRMAPEIRRAQILDDASRLILEEGLSAVSMERVGREAGISKALVYNYFPSRDHLLAALLHREQSDLRERGLTEAIDAPSFSDLIRRTSRLFLEQSRSRGALIQALMSDPSVARLMEDENRAGRERTIAYFVQRVRDAFGFEPSLAPAAVDMLMAVTAQAGHLVSDGGLEIEVAEEMCVQLIVGGLERLASTHPRR